ncbi:MAG: hypothetical protein DYG89_14680 [Caldilinea sp. CFX5]|nr:hypothetical protein [Caldilinea sp. CFX5]
MKRFYYLFTFVLFIFVLFIFVSTLLTLVLATSLPVSAARMTNAPTNCSPAALQESYAFRTATTVNVAPGTVIALPEALIATSPVLLAGQGTIEFNGQGQAVLTATYDVNDEAITATAYPGSYTLDVTCNATVLLDNGIRFTMRLVSINGQPTLVSTTPGFLLLNNE